MIPDDAVEAAAKASWERVNSEPWGCTANEDLRRHIDQREYLEDARVMLEAAAPHLLEANESCCCGTCGL